MAQQRTSRTKAAAAASGAKRPQDRRPASAKADVQPSAMTVAYDGHEYTIEPDRLNDIELLEQFAAAQSADGGDGIAQSIAALRMVRLLLGDAQYDGFKADQVAAHGVCSATALGELFKAIMEASPGN